MYKHFAFGYILGYYIVFELAGCFIVYSFIGHFSSINTDESFHIRFEQEISILSYQ